MNGNLFNKVEELKEKLSDMQVKIDKDPLNRSLREEEIIVLDEYITIAQDEEKLLCMIIDGAIHEKDQVGVQFAKHFESFLGSNSNAEKMEEKDGCLFNKIDDIDAGSMIKEVNDDEIKRALFGIDDSKARGPDGFTSKFFKKAWNTIKMDFCNAIKEFFRTGKLLGEVNATLITLVPKMQTPLKVTDFRPIACCNVVYKCISKILTNRIKPVLNKLVDQNQSAFLPGRAITDNILLTQELLSGYNSKNGLKRCSLKIDIHKAYDTVSWSFLEKILQYYGFPSAMIQWIMVCISTPKFTICVNGERFGYFKGDDLLMLCHGDPTSIKIIKNALEKFSKISGLHPNMSKSTMFCGSLNEEEKKLFLSILPFQIGRLPVRYLGVPLMDKKIGMKDCKSLIDKDFVFQLPTTVIKDIETLFKGFLWCNGDLTRGKAMVVWKEYMGHSKSYGSDSWCWKTILSLRNMVKDHIRHKISNGRNILAWYDRWNDNQTLSNYISKREVCLAGFNDQSKLCDIVDGNRWKWPDDWMVKHKFLLNIHVPTFNDEPDNVLWATNQGKMQKTGKLYSKTEETEDMGCLDVCFTVSWVTVLLPLTTRNRISLCRPHKWTIPCTSEYFWYDYTLWLIIAFLYWPWEEYEELCLSPERSNQLYVP
ncbi:RNA-directed DNA polymerase, eukaryota, reverse transcriptase zinc-binding domain protein [Tanacetum coccineum]